MRDLVKQVHCKNRGEGCDVIITGRYTTASNVVLVREPAALGSQVHRSRNFEVSNVVRPARRIVM